MNKLHENHCFLCQKPAEDTVWVEQKWPGAIPYNYHKECFLICMGSSNIINTTRMITYTTWLRFVGEEYFLDDDWKLYCRNKTATYHKDVLVHIEKTL